MMGIDYQLCRIDLISEEEEETKMFTPRASSWTSYG